MNSTAKLLGIAEGEVGYREGRSGGRWNNKQKYSPEVPGLEWSNWQPWCQTFQSWLFRKAGIANLAPVTASCALAVNWFTQRSRFSSYPAVGAQIFYGPNGGSHVGLVTKYDGDYVWTIEGNTNTNGSAEGDGVYARKRSRRDPYVHGYGYPAYKDGSVSADPNAARYGYKTENAGSVADLPGTKPPAKKYAAFPGSDWFKKNPKHSVITAMGNRLVAEGCSVYEDGPGPQWTEADRKSYAKWQRKLGFSGTDADGWPGKTSWDKLKVPTT
ncbi:peptidoglycan-binding protein [Streptomyces tsukubensis]|uniref:peptidoglycan-binding protein n=1 Tax=Streptomyces tsukubensis TaxID=83656 RepID=UPI00344F2255